MNTRGGPSLWSATAPPMDDFARLAATVRAQIAVIGAGYTGLSAALHLGEAGRDVVVLDGMEVGDGSGKAHWPDRRPRLLGICSCRAALRKPPRRGRGRTTAKQTEFQQLKLIHY